MFEMKTITSESIPEALKKAERYRLLGEPDDAESICLDILTVEPENQHALITLILALTDKFSMGDLSPSYEKARELVEKLDKARGKTYYLGILYERRAKYYLKKGGPGSKEASYAWFIKAMDSFEQALTDCDPPNQGAVLRWNSCARILNSNPDIKADSEKVEMLLDSYETPH